MRRARNLCLSAGQVLAGTPYLRAEEAAIFTVNDLTPGSYLFWCSVVYGNAAHAAYGMVGTLTITPEAPASSIR